MSDSAISSKSEEICCICLGEVVEKSLLDMCLHFFCFDCIKRWSEKKSICPLCTVPFKTIMYNIKSDYEYLEYKISDINTNTNDTQYDRRRDLVNQIRLQMSITSRFDQEPGSRRFSNGHERRSHRSTNPAKRTMDFLTRSRWAPGAKEMHTTSTLCRSEIYNMNLWAKDLKAIEGIPVRVRDVTPTFLSRNEACCHRLYRWLNREVPAVLGYTSRFNTSEVIGIVIDNCKKFFILSENFNDKICQIFGAKTRHFVHEFYQFASSPYDMEDYDRNVIYGPPAENSFDVTLSSESDVEDVVVIQPSSSQDQSILLLDDDDDDDDVNDMTDRIPRSFKSSLGKDDLSSIETSSYEGTNPSIATAKSSFKGISTVSTMEKTEQKEINRKRKFIESDEEEDEDDYDNDNSKNISHSEKFKSVLGVNLVDEFLSESRSRVEVNHISFKKHHSGHKNRPKWHF